MQQLTRAFNTVNIILCVVVLTLEGKEGQSKTRLLQTRESFQYFLGQGKIMTSPIIIQIMSSYQKSHTLRSQGPSTITTVMQLLISN